MYSSGSLGPFLLCQRSSSAVTNKSTFSSVCKPLNLALALQQNLVQLFISTWPQALKTSQHSDYGSAYFIAYIYIMMLSTSTCSSSTTFQFNSYCLSKELLWWKLAYRFLFLQWWMSFGIHVSTFSWNLLNILKLRMAIKKTISFIIYLFLGEPESKILCCTNVCTESIPPYSCTRTILLLMLLPWSLSVQFSLHHLYLLPPLSQPVSIFGGNNLICNCLPTFQCSCFAQCVRPWHCLLCCCLLVQQCKYAIQSSL